jgi:hypothetical protein
MKRWTRKSRSADNFAFFRKAVTEIVEPQLTAFGFRHVATIEHIPEGIVKYQNETTGINVRYEWESLVSISLVKLEPTGSEITEGKRYDLLLLMEIREPAIDANKFSGGDKEWTNAYIEERLHEYTSFLKEGARDVLTGDFSIFPELKKLSAHYRRKHNKDLFGTYSGITPRFSTRPTLAQVFAGAKDTDPYLVKLLGNKLKQDKTASLIYEAYWDHEYSTLEIAQFLNEPEESIHRKLEEQDDLD